MALVSIVLVAHMRVSLFAPQLLHHKRFSTGREKRERERERERERDRERERESATKEQKQRGQTF